ncbi:MAG TPA: hypothetical protein VGN32_02210 [Ktedonobacterales bacterium]|nr:hypothetical protein [Ktedonobacterales bacterium]
MSRNLYRAYLYVMCTALLVFAAIELGSLLNTLLLLTPLRGMYDNVPDHNALVQGSVLALIAVVLSLGVGGFHYWLIRRDLARDASAGGAAVRSLALNLVQAVAALVALYAGLNAIGLVGTSPIYSGATFLVAIWFVAALVFVLVQLERARARPNPGAATVLRRLHLYGVHTVVLITVLTVVSGTVDRTIQALMIATRAISDPCLPKPGSFVPNNVGCGPSYGLAGGWLQVLWVLLAWALYFWLARGDERSVLREVAHFLGFAIGLGSFIAGFERAAELVLRTALHTGAGFAQEFAFQYAFVGLLVLGAIVAAAYAYWLLSNSPATTLGRLGTGLTLIALAAVGFGIPFYVGIAQVARGLLEALIRGTPLAPAEWALGLALLIAGLAHVAAAYLLRSRTTGEAPIGPRRAYTLAALAAGSLTATIGAAIGLYIVVTGTLGSPVSPHWGLDARTALINTLVGLFIAGLHLWRFIEQRRTEPHAAPASEQSAVPLAPTTAGPVLAAGDPVGAVLDALLAGRLTRDEAATQLRTLTQAPAR